MFGAQPTYPLAASSQVPEGEPRGVDAQARVASDDAAPINTNSFLPDPLNSSAEGAGSAPASPPLTPLPAAILDAPVKSGDEASPAITSPLAPVTFEAVESRPSSGPPAMPFQAVDLDDAPIVAPATGSVPLADLAAQLPLLAPVFGLSDQLSGPTITAPIQQVLEPVLATPEMLVDTLSVVTGGVADVVEALPLDALTVLPAAAIGAVGDVSSGLIGQDLLGDDPAAGIATLVNLVTVADVVDLKDAGAPVDSSVAGSGGPIDDLLDTLSAEPLPLPSLLDDDGDLPDAPPPVVIPDLGLGI